MGTVSANSHDLFRFQGPLKGDDCDVFVIGDSFGIPADDRYGAQPVEVSGEVY